MPTQTQALIWGDLVPQMILSATMPRFWNVTPVQMHWVSASMRHAEAMIAEAAVNPAIRGRVLEVVGNTASLARSDKVVRSLTGGNVRGAVNLLTPSELYAIGAEPPGFGGETLTPPRRQLAHFRSAEPRPGELAKQFRARGALQSRR